eukprot:m51a1_g10463 putative atp-binding cassette sub-family g member 1 isoform x1 (600) ;mRNA; r:39719-41802
MSAVPDRDCEAVQAPPSAPSSTSGYASAALTFRDVTYDVPRRGQPALAVLRGVSGHVPAGAFLGIVGPSGSGKTTLMDILAGRRKCGAVGGDVAVGAERVVAGDVAARYAGPRRTAYVMQDCDVFEGLLTARETVEMVLRLRSPSLASRAGDSAVCSALSSLGLLDVAGTALSGGEKRRLSIAVELATRPAVLLIDEVTSGLDSQSALRVVACVRSLGCTVVCTVHQPRSAIFHLFDRLMVMQFGRCVYFGPSMSSVPYFAKLGLPCPLYTNPADFILDTIGDKGQADGGKQLADDFASSPEFWFTLSPAAPEASPAAAAATEGPGSSHGDPTRRRDGPARLWMQFAVLIGRMYLVTLRDPAQFGVRLVASVLISLLAGYAFFQTPRGEASTRVNLFLGCAFGIFCVPSIPRFACERRVFARERASGYYGPTSYYLAATVVELPLMLAMIGAYCGVSYWMVGLRPELPRFATFTLIVFLTVMVSFSAAHLAATASGSVGLAVALYGFFFVYSLLFGGFFIAMPKMPANARWLVRSSYMFYSFEGMLMNEFEGDEALSWLRPQYDVGGSPWRDVAVLAAFFLGLRVGSYLCLCFLHREKR